MESNKKPTEEEEANNKEVTASKQTSEKLKEKDDQPQNLRKGKEEIEGPSQGQKQDEKTSTSPLPYPQRFNKETNDQHFSKFFEVFKKLEINIPLAEALEQMPLYAKFLKELINKKRSWHEKETVLLTEECTTARAIIDVEKGERIFRVQNEQMIIDVFKAMQHPSKQEDYMRVDIIESLVEEMLEANHHEQQEEEREEDQETMEAQVAEISSEKEVKQDKKEEVPKQDLKPLPIHLKYAFLGIANSFQVIINSSLTEEEEGKLPNVLKAHKDALGWTIDDLKDIANYKVGRKIPKKFTKQQVKKLLNEAKKFLWEELFLFRRCSDGMIRKCVPESEVRSILWHCHGSAYGGYFGPKRTATKVLQSGFYWPTIFKDAREFIHQCNECQRGGGLTKRSEMPQNYILEVELFDLWGIDFMGPFPPSYSFKYILVAVEYVSKWVKAIATTTCDAQVVLQFLKKHIFTRYRVPKGLVSDGGSHFCNKQMEKLLYKYGVMHKVATPYHPQTNG
ncbi:uncharacterized protein [Arachis hypogaea]|uniref:uncharacterized protein n=1 Tax=Arachis hypogaea TaxID=3818 RepID=UPI003B2161FA